MSTSESELHTLRRLRSRASRLLNTVTDDLAAFRHQKDKVTFRRQPGQESEINDVKVTTTCSCLMALCISRKLIDYYGAAFKETARRSFELVFFAKWQSAGLTLDNAFSTVMVLRTAGFLATAGVLDKAWFDGHKKRFAPANGEKTLRDIADWLSKDPSNFGIENYPVTSTILYWFVDALSETQFSLPEDSWDTICKWASSELYRQQSLVHADHDARMDPVGMAMAACLCSRLHKIAKEGNLGTANRHLTFLPSMPEMQHAIDLLFKKQSRSGIWPKYFPLFHYPKAGSNFCFTFEMLEAVLTEFGETPASVLDRADVINGLQYALEWCERNRLEFSTLEAGERVIYRGWNSGGELESLHSGKPESWATAVVHMFLSELNRVLGKRIKRVLLEAYGARFGKDVKVKWGDLMKVDVKLRSGDTSTVRDVLDEQILKHAKEYDSTALEKMRGCTSALLFGPPGTSKTTIVRAFAAELDWPLVEIEPSDFLTDGIENIYSKARDVFKDLEDIPGVVVFFDEMDALVLTRGDARAPLDVTSRFLTTSMLPKLAKLHDDGRVVFFFATNYQSKFDPAIKRPGRFDILLCIGPPSWQNILDDLARLVPAKCGSILEVQAELVRLVDGLTGVGQKDALDLLTRNEAMTLFQLLSHGNDLLTELQKLDSTGFNKILSQFAATITLTGDVKEDYEREKELSAIQPLL